MRLELRSSFDFPDHQGWDAYLSGGSTLAEGCVVRYGPDHELVVSRTLEPGWYYDGYGPHNRGVAGGPCGSRDEALQELSAALLREGRNG